MLPTAKIGPYTLPNPLIVAPMAGVTDRPFRQLCRRIGAFLPVSYIVISDSKLCHTRKSPTRLNHYFDPQPPSVPIASSDPSLLPASSPPHSSFSPSFIPT
ncbi:MAG: tRNA-dihydrouridine synthase, partial [Alteromonadaceae bacterium]|nr:tRNA-dihydrouridine synthase [Alteromonadaceae bacterium]